MPSFKLLAKEFEHRTILLVSGWQYHNIGDIAHTPGLLQLLNLFAPECQIILWPNHQHRSIDRMLSEAYPDIEIVHGDLEEGYVASSEVIEAAGRADFLLHGSGPSIVGAPKIEWWKKVAGKPYGIYGVTVGHVGDYYKDIIDHASFLFTRETLSLKNLEEANVECPVTGMGPDATFAMNLQDEAAAMAFLQDKKLESKEFICVVPRLRKTPYYSIYPEWGWDEEKIREIDDLNDRYKEVDHAKAREAMITWVRQTGKKVLVCPEMTYQLDIMQELLIDPLPEDVKSHVEIRETYWLCNEAAAVYKQAFAVLSFECHSPIMACYNGTPAFYLRQPEDTIKGQMWYDIGLDDWVFEIEDTNGAQISERLMHMYDEPVAARVYLEKAMDRVRSMQVKNFSQIRPVLYNK